MGKAVPSRISVTKELRAHCMLEASVGRVHIRELNSELLFKDRKTRLASTMSSAKEDG